MTADEELRGRLAEALPRSVGPAALRYPPEFGEPDPLTPFGREVLDALLPEVKRYAAEAWDDGYEAGVFAGAEDPGRADELAEDQP